MLGIFGGHPAQFGNLYTIVSRKVSTSSEYTTAGKFSATEKSGPLLATARDRLHSGRYGHNSRIRHYDYGRVKLRRWWDRRQLGSVRCDVGQGQTAAEDGSDEVDQQHGVVVADNTVGNGDGLDGQKDGVNVYADFCGDVHFVTAS